MPLIVTNVPENQTALMQASFHAVKKYVTCYNTSVQASATTF